jgi:hypothetical protein
MGMGVSLLFPLSERSELYLGLYIFKD